jgi:excisionase family DNA binding protein
MQAIAIPEPILSAVVSILSPFRVGLTPHALEAALSFEQEQEPADKLLSRKEAAAALHISLPTLDRMCYENEIRPVKIRGRVFIRQSTVDRIIRGEEVAA